MRHYPSRPNGRWSDEELEYGWIVHGPGGGSEPVAHRDRFYRKARKLLDGFLEDGYSATPSAKRGLFRSLWRMAEAHRFVVGKWKVFPPAEVADEVWRDVCNAMDQGLLGDQAKISRFNPQSGAYLICVYCNDFSDTEECERVLENLARVCEPYGVRCVANFKADFLTMLGVYTVKGEGRRIEATYPLGEMGLRKYWPNEKLKEVLDRVKERQRRDNI